ncbi:hypothetical protein ACQY0O_006844 [Thecaphora frezii]
MKLGCALLGGLAAAAVATASPRADLASPSRTVHMERRQTQQPASGAEQTAIAQQALTDPVGAAKAARQMPFIAGQFGTGNLSSYDIAGDNAQLPWNSGIYFEPEANVAGDPDNGWQELPEIAAFDLNRTWTVKDNAIMPFYQSKGYDVQQVKRAVLIMPGKPRDCWKYTSLVGNALSVEVANSSSGVTNSSVLILGPCWLNSDDQKAGAVKDNELYWHGTQWQRGDAARGPGNTTLSTFSVLDAFLDMLFDKSQFPALNRVVVAGHSMGAQMVQRYAMLKDAQSYDGNVAYWVGNPGSYVWPVTDRTYSNASCTDVDAWPFGLDGGYKQVPKFARDKVQNNKSQVVDAYRSRHIHYNLGLLDNGQGDTSCEAMTQGYNHLERGCDIVAALAAMPGGFPVNHTLNLMPNVSHQDYPMLSYNISLFRLFADGLDTQEAYKSSKKQSKSKTNDSSGSSERSGASGGASTVGLMLTAGLATVVGVATLL